MFLVASVTVDIGLFCVYGCQGHSSRTVPKNIIIDTTDGGVKSCPNLDNIMC